MAAPVFNCFVFNSRVFQNDCEEEEVVGGAAPMMVLRRSKSRKLEILAIIRAFLDTQ